MNTPADDYNDEVIEEVLREQRAERYAAAQRAEHWHPLDPEHDDQQESQ